MFPALLAPLMQLTSFGIGRVDRLPTGVGALWQQGFAPLSLVVMLFSIAIPFLFLGLVTIVIGSILLGIQRPVGRLFRWGMSLRHWAMVEVYLVGCCVAYSRLEAVGTIEVKVGGWCLMGAALAALLTGLTLDERAVWRSLNHSDGPVRSRGSSLETPLSPESVIVCHSCGLVTPARQELAPCARCAATLHHRKPAALGRTLALVITGVLLYVPAMMLPVLSIVRFGRDEPNTILSGVRELIGAGLWPLALLVFVASILVPLLKLFGLAFMLALTGRRSTLWLTGRTRLYHFIDAIGRWSSIDLFMISILVAMVEFGNLTSVHAEGGATAFAAVVVVTMFASQCFDPRLMWDAVLERHDG